MEAIVVYLLTGATIAAFCNYFIPEAQMFEGIEDKSATYKTCVWAFAMIVILFAWLPLCMTLWLYDKPK